jgi:hypothetical protein
VIARHGAPDLTVTAALRARLRGRPDEAAADEPAVDRHYFDHFIFETAAGGDAGVVLRVSSQYFDTATARPSGPDAGGSTWTATTVDGRELTLFWVEGREVARLVEWGGPSAQVVEGAVPAGEYLRHYPTGEVAEKLVHDGTGGCVYVSFYRSGPVYRRYHYEAHRLEGRLTDFYEHGSPRVEAAYRAGRLHGRLVEWSPDGAIGRERFFADGEEVRPGETGPAGEPKEEG